MDGVPRQLRPKMHEALSVIPGKGAMAHSQRYFGAELADIKNRIAPLLIELDRVLRKTRGKGCPPLAVGLGIGAFGFGLMQVYFFLFVVVPMMRGQGAKAPQKPWEGAEGLEWEVPSPAPWHTFETPPKLDNNAKRVVA